MKTHSFLLTAGVALALAFTISCYSDRGIADYESALQIDPKRMAQ